MPNPLFQNLGTLTEPVLIFGGPYSNLQATQALLSRSRELGIQPDHILCTGDVVAYAGDPAHTTDAVIQSGMRVLMGNCEESFGYDEDDCGCGFDEGSACDVLSRQWYAHASAELSPEHRAWMRNLPRAIRFQMAGLSVSLIHGGFENISRWIFNSTPALIKHQEIAQIEQTGPTDIVVGGHCGLPFFDDLGDKLWLNAGVVGMPANDGTPRTWFIVMTPTMDGIQIDLKSLTYEHQQAAKRMTDLNLAGAYAETLVNGLWPNMDVLGDQERAQSGLALEPWTTFRRSPLRSAAE